MITLALAYSHILFWSGIYALFIRRDNLILTMIFFELSLLGISLFFVTSGLILEDHLGLISFFLLLTLAGVESALGLALVTTYYNTRISIKWVEIASIKN